MSGTFEKLRLTRKERRRAISLAVKADPGRVGLESILVVAEWLSFIQKGPGRRCSSPAGRRGFVGVSRLEMRS
ncbi:hypothetical protein [Mesorhizobium sp.]|uniref:hypothetical protein n=1 Tax=Mesorhizobium sp. TaxID=1871066 RepID=UPI0025F359C6|nr:hypothetical protein [Mesorhizobium sp.]